MSNLDELRAELEKVNAQIEKLTPKDSYLDAVNRSFPMGRAGGSGKYTKSLNRRRERDLERTIAASKKLTPLYARRNTLEVWIKKAEQEILDLASGASQQRAETKQANLQKIADYWNSLKPGDQVDIGGNAPATITKKNKKSIETGPGCKWTAIEIIGREAANLIQ